jgi:hypothetical protein
MGKERFDLPTARRILQHYNIDIHVPTLRTQLSAGRSGSRGEPATLTDEQAAKVREIAHRLGTRKQPDASAIRSRLGELSCLADWPITPKDVEIRICEAPHTPPSSLPQDKMAVYLFFYRGQCLKVGKVWCKSIARYTSHHYHPKSSNSNLAKSILESPDSIGISCPQSTCVGDWIKTNTDRINVLFPVDWGTGFLTLAEAFLQCWLRPVYEGFKTQKMR